MVFLFYRGRDVIDLYEDNYKTRDSSLSGSDVVYKNKYILRFYFVVITFSVMFLYAIFNIISLLYNNDIPTIRFSSKDSEIRTPNTILDRQGQILASHIERYDIYVDILKVADTFKYAEELFSGDLTKMQNFVNKINSMKNSGRIGNVLVSRDITEEKKNLLLNKKLSGVFFKKRIRRVYLFGENMPHILGTVDTENKGIAGFEYYLREINAKRPISLSVDVSLQHAVRQELLSGYIKYMAKAAAAILMDIYSGEVLALVSLPDFNINQYRKAEVYERFNTATLGTFEMGSTMKLVTVAAVLDEGLVTKDTIIDTTTPIKFSQKVLEQPENSFKNLTVSEILIRSSNIGVVRLGMMLGKEKQKEIIKKLGLFKKVSLEVPERGKPQVPKKWSDTVSFTLSYGYGLALTPMHILKTAAIIANGGYNINPTLLKCSRYCDKRGEPILKEETSMVMKDIMLDVVKKGTGKGAFIKDFGVMGKTGTAEKAEFGAYNPDTLVSSFVSVFPYNNPRYALIVLFDEPNTVDGEGGEATASRVAAPTAGNIIRRIIPLIQFDLKR